MPHVVSPYRLDPNRSALLLVDLQEKLCPAIMNIEQVIERSRLLTEASDLLSVPRAATVQYPQGLGELVEPIREKYAEAEEKLDFSAAVCRGSIDRWGEGGRDQILIVGIETHICILQTALDLAAEGKQPHIVVDAVSARNLLDHQTGLERMAACGIRLLSLESVLFEWLGNSRHESFRTISGWVKNLNR